VEVVVVASAGAAVVEVVELSQACWILLVRDL
jgi:hypothetical protein